MDALMDGYMRDSMAGRTVPEPAEREAARRAIVMDCVNAQADATAAEAPPDVASSVVTQACSGLIGQYIQAEAADAAFRGDPPASPTQMADMRTAFGKAATARIRDRRSGKCER